MTPRMLFGLIPLLYMW